MSLHEWYRRRERGLPARIGDADIIYRTIFRSLQPKMVPADRVHPCHYRRDCGAICNLEFSPDGTLLAAACEYKSIVLFDPLTEKQICAVNNAHQECVNCIKFIDHHTFATCSDDTTVALWDSRNLSTKLRTLNGHNGWVKNIEYSKQEGILISSGLDGLIHSWELKNSTEQGCIYQRLLYMPGLMRCRLAPAEDRLVLCTSSGYLMIVHDLNLATLAGDLVGFRPSIHRLNLMRKQKHPLSFPCKRKNNRIEFVTDFPPGDDAELISGLTIHPQGWCVLSRNISYDEKTEWSVVHDIQCGNDDESGSDDEKLSASAGIEEAEETSLPRERNACITSPNATSQYATDRNDTRIVSSDGTINPSARETTTWCSAALLRTDLNQCVKNNRHNRTETTEPVADGDATHCCHDRVGCRHPKHGSRTKPAANRNDPEPVKLVKKSPVSNISNRWPSKAATTGAKTNGSKRVPESAARLLYYIQESNKVEGYMREACFSPDGRVICSPHDDYGVRLLAFNEHCNEIQYARYSVTDSEPQILRELKYKPCYPHVVISSQFSPRFPLLVTGCLLGNVVWNLPVLN